MLRGNKDAFTVRLHEVGPSLGGTLSVPPPSTRMRSPSAVTLCEIIPALRSTSMTSEVTDMWLSGLPVAADGPGCGQYRDAGKLGRFRTQGAPYPIQLLLAFAVKAR